MAKRYGVLPSELAKIDIRDFQFNLLVAERAVEDENKRQEKAQKKSLARKRA